LARGNYRDDVTVARLSSRERKILLLLLRLKENRVDGESRLREASNLMQILEPPTEYVTTVPFMGRGGGQTLPCLNEGSWRRSFLGLRRRGLLSGYKAWRDRRLRYCLTDEGELEASRIREEVRGYVDEWGPLIQWD